MIVSSSTNQFGTVYIMCSKTKYCYKFTSLQKSTRTLKEATLCVGVDSPQVASKCGTLHRLQVNVAESTGC